MFLVLKLSMRGREFLLLDFSNNVYLVLSLSSSYEPIACMKYFIFNGSIETFHVCRGG